MQSDAEVRCKSVDFCMTTVFDYCMTLVWLEYDFGQQKSSKILTMLGTGIQGFHTVKKKAGFGHTLVKQ